MRHHTLQLASGAVLLCNFTNNLLIEHVEGEILAHVKERIGCRACARSVHQIYQRALLSRERHALVPHFRVSETCRPILVLLKYIRELFNTGPRSFSPIVRYTDLLKCHQNPIKLLTPRPTCVTNMTAALTRR